MPRQPHVFAVGIALTIALALIPITAEQGGGQPSRVSGSKQPPPTVLHPEAADQKRRDSDQPSQPSPPPETLRQILVATNNPDPSPPYEQSKTDRFVDYLINPTTWLAAAIAFFACWQVLVYRQIRDHAQDIERAQVNVPYTDWRVEIEDSTGTGHLRQFTIHYNITNSGRTHAVITNTALFGTELEPRPDKQPSAMKFTNERLEWEGQAIIAAGQSIPRTWKPSLLASEEELKRLWDGELVYWVQGRVNYRDIFDKSHYTNFTARLWLPDGIFSFVLEKGYSDGY